MTTFLEQFTEEKGKLKLIRDDHLVSLTIKINCLLIFLTLSLLFLFWQRLPPQIPLFFSRPWGESQLASPNALFLFPFLSLLVLVLNFGLMIKTIEGEKLLAQILSSASLTFSFLCLVALFQTIRLIS
jgi:hypothetical protein